MPKQSKHFRFIIPLSEHTRINGQPVCVHRGDLEIEYVGYHYLRQGLEPDPDTDYDADINSIHYKGADITELVMHTAMFNDQAQEIIEAAKQNAIWQFDQLRITKKEYEAELAFENERGN